MNEVILRYRTGHPVVIPQRGARPQQFIIEEGEKHSMIWGMFMSVTMESAVFMGKNYLDNCHSIANTKDLTFETNVRHIYKIGV